MNRISLLKNIIQEYAWGSYTDIPELLGDSSPSDRPQAELWMGAHPKASSLVNVASRWTSLDRLIDEDPQSILGERVAEKFNGEIPFLFKVLAVAQPLSIQAHPNMAQAEAGFKRENRLGIPMDAYQRNYKDRHHKPECICALTPFWALNGFRDIPEIISRMVRCCPTGLGEGLNALGSNPTDEGLKQFFQSLMQLESVRKETVIAEALDAARIHREEDAVFDWMLRLQEAYPSDIGVLSPILLNLVHLQPGQAMFLPAGQLHAYLSGLGVELMANSDNVLRGGLTPKHVDVPELLNVLCFHAGRIEILSPEPGIQTEYRYPGDAEEFVLSVISPGEGEGYRGKPKSVEILLCVEGGARITSDTGEESVSLTKGRSILIPAAAGPYHIKGEATLYKAAVRI